MGTRRITTTSSQHATGWSPVRFLKSIWFILTLDCQGSAELTSESLDRPLHWAETLAVKCHCMICKKSKLLNRQLKALDNKIQNSLNTESNFTLSDEARQKIKRSLQQQRDGQ